ncbi:TetR/AcrR family transcriptional regulator [Microbacterium sp. NPDC089189]|uniref:TetR/AcrR family transcriptional regulator n=1 Tax=Microbacterium sp. NPDC089189 TaxID=3154972 RepID=UPI00341B89F6
MAQYAKTAAVRRSIIEACSAAFSETGFHGASMAEIARRAGISHTGLLHHFPRKEDLLTEVLELQDERSAQYLREHAGPSSDADPVHILEGMVATLVEMDREVGLSELAATLTGEASSPTHPAHAHFAERYRNIRRFLTRIYARLDAEERLAPGADPAQLAVATIALSEGLRSQWLFDREGDLRIDAVVATVVGMFVPETAGGATAD